MTNVNSQMMAGKFGCTQYVRQAQHRKLLTAILVIAAMVVGSIVGKVHAAPLLAGVSKVDITNIDSGAVNDRLWVKALVALTRLQLTV